VIRFTKHEVLLVHQRLIDTYGGIAGYHSNVLEICLNQPFQTYHGRDLYPNDPHKLCMLCYLIIKKHPFIDGNKRVGMVLLILGLRRHDYRFDLTNDEVIEFGFKLAANEWGIKELITRIERAQIQ